MFNLHSTHDMNKRMVGKKKIYFGLFMALMVCILAYSALFMVHSGDRGIFRETRLAMGTVVEVALFHPSEARAREAIEAAFREIERVERIFSGYKPESVVSELNREAFTHPVAVDDEAISLLRVAIDIGRDSGGAFDITIEPIRKLWNFESGGRVPSGEEILSSIDKVGIKYLNIDQKRNLVGFDKSGMALDLGGISKGWAVDKAIEKLKAMGIKGALIDAGGDIRLLGVRPGKDHWRIGVQNPREPGRLMLSLDLRETAIVTSGDYERFFMDGDIRYHHIIDPVTGMPARGCQSVTIIAPTAVEADACATAAFVLGPERGLEFLSRRPGVRGLIVDANGGLHWTDAALAGSAHH